MKYRPYSEYKDSGVEWLGLIPSDWGICRFKKFCFERTELSSDGHETLLSVSAYTGITPRSDIIEENDTLVRAESLEGYRICHPGDLVINVMLAWNKGLGVTSYEGIVSPAYAVFFFGDSVHPWYFHYLARSDQYSVYFRSFSTGVIDSRLRLYPDVFLSLSTIFPPLSTQRKIAAFLDAETARIDGLIKEYEDLIALLSEKRQALISRAVTRGLSELVSPDDPEFGAWAKPVTFKDSGVEWIGKIPEGWICLRLKNKLVQNDGGIWGEEPNGSDSDHIVLRSTEQSVDGFWRIIEPAYRSLDEDAFEATMLREGDLLITKSSGSALHIGKASLVSKDIERMNCSYSNFMQRLRVVPEINPKYVWYILNNIIAREQFNYLSNSTTGLANLSKSVLDNTHLPLPPLSFQNQIVRYLDREGLKQIRLMEEVQATISLLEEHRAALITNAVTGKINVEGIV